MKVESIYISRVTGRWTTSAKIEVPGLGDITISDCLAGKTIAQLEKQVQAVTGQKLHLTCRDALNLAVPPKEVPVSAANFGDAAVRMAAAKKRRNECDNAGCAESATLEMCDCCTYKRGEEADDDSTQD